MKEKNHRKSPALPVEKLENFAMAKIIYIETLK